MIRGTTRLIAHLGYPTETFKAPMIYNPYFERHGIDAVVVPMGVKADAYPAVLAALRQLTNFHGALVTMPLKISTIDLVDDRSAAAEIAGACNAIRRGADGRLHGDMFDGEGFVRGVLRRQRRIAGARALVVGSGGVGSAIAASLAAAGVGAIGLYDIRAEVAAALASRLRRRFPALPVDMGSNDPAGCDIVVNATPLGMAKSDPLPMDASRISPAAFVGEVVLSEEMTPFLRAAAQRGCAFQVGTDMLFEMIPAYLEFFGLRSATADELRASARITH